MKRHVMTPVETRPPPRWSGMGQVQPPLLLFVYFAPDPNMTLLPNKMEAESFFLLYGLLSSNCNGTKIISQLANKALPCPRKVPLAFLHIRNGAATSMPFGADALLLGVSRPNNADIHPCWRRSLQAKALTQWLRRVRPE